MARDDKEFCRRMAIVEGCFTFFESDGIIYLTGLGL